MKTRFLVPLFCAAWMIPSALLAIDTDGDGMENTWETNMGLSTTNPDDALADKDGDRVPNLWEFMRGTAANNANSLPVFDAIVTMNPATGATPPQFATLQEAYDSLPETYDYFIIQVKRGYYAASLAMGIPRRVCWIGETGPDKSTGFEGVLLADDTIPDTGISFDATGLEFGEDTVLDGITIESFAYQNQNALPQYPAISAYYGSSFLPRIRLVNVLIRYWKAWAGGITAGAIVNYETDLWLVHSTIFYCEGTDGTTNGNGLTFRGIYNDVSIGKLHTMNSIVVGGDSASDHNQIGGNLQRIWGVNSVLEADTTTTYGTPTQLTGTSIADPGLNQRGHVKQTSPTNVRTGAAVLGTGNSLSSVKDIHGTLRPATAGTISIGADQWKDTDADGLPDWWEAFWFGNQLARPNDDPDGDYYYPNITEYELGLRPVKDQDYDHLDDLWEMLYFNVIGTQGAADNPDGDAGTNYQEQAAGSNPTVFEADFDQDGWTDAWEITTFGSVLESPMTDFDGDGLSNGDELNLVNSNMFIADTNSDGVSDGVAWVQGLSVTGSDTDGDGLDNSWELTHGTNPLLRDTDHDGVSDGQDALPLDPSTTVGVSVSGPPVIVLTSPLNAVLIP